jgi:hypothetical protein
MWVGHYPPPLPYLWYLVGSRASALADRPLRGLATPGFGSRGESTRTYGELQYIVGWVVHPTLMV